MFTVHCEGHGAEVLLWPGSVEHIVNLLDAMVVVWRCSCGQRGALLTGRDVDERETALVG